MGTTQTSTAQVAIVGAGPSGLLLAHVLAQAGVAAVIVERQSADHVSARIRAGVLEDATVSFLSEVGARRANASRGAATRRLYPYL